MLTSEAEGRLPGKSGDLLLFCEVGLKNLREEVQDLAFPRFLGLSFPTCKLGPRVAVSQGRGRIQCEL